MRCEINPAQSRYTKRMFLAAFFSVVCSAAAGLPIRYAHLTGIPAYALAILPALPIVAALLATGLYLGEEKDEFQRTLYIQSLLGGMAITLALTTAWGFMEDFARAPHLRLVWVYPLFWIAVGMSFPVVRLRYR